MIFDRFARWFTRWFGSAATFCIVTALVLLWAAPAGWMGAGHWNSTLGLAGNTIESTAELLLAIAIQYTTSRVERQQQQHMAALERLEQAIAQHLGITSDIAEHLGVYEEDE